MAPPKLVGPLIFQPFDLPFQGRHSEPIRVFEWSLTALIFLAKKADIATRDMTAYLVTPLSALSVIAPQPCQSTSPAQVRTVAQVLAGGSASLRSLLSKLHS